MVAYLSEAPLNQTTSIRQKPSLCVDCPELETAFSIDERKCFGVA